MKRLTLPVALALILGAGTQLILRVPTEPAAWENVSLSWPATVEGSGDTKPTGTHPATPQGWIEYRNAAYDFTLYHPPELMVKTYDEGGNSKTFAFEDSARNKGFQIFITPYTEKHITPERFHMDESSGVIIDPKEITIGSSERATLFFGHDALLGDTREVWFIHRGFLYEITTYKDFDALLSRVVGTLTFISNS